jgi:hypothetical protein
MPDRAKTPSASGRLPAATIVDEDKAPESEGVFTAAKTKDSAGKDKAEAGGSIDTAKPPSDSPRDS